MSSTYFTRTTGTSTDNKKFTFSSWVKRVNSSSSHTIFSVDTDSSNYIFLRWKSNGDLQFSSNVLGTGQIAFVTDRVFRDESAWYSIIVAVDSTLSTASDRVKIYINGIRETSFSTSTTPDINKEFAFLNNGTFEIGRRSYDTSNIYSGLMAMVEFVDGTALTSASFGSTDSNTGIWTPQASSTISDYGTNGFKLKMDTTSPGADTSGKGNTFTVGAGTPTLTQGSPSNVFATMNPLVTTANVPVYSNGNNTIVGNSSGNGSTQISTIGSSSGKFYVEVKCVAYSNTTGAAVGVVEAGEWGADSLSIAQDSYFYGTSSGYGYKISNGNKVNNSTSGSAYGNSYTTGDIIGIALDLDNNKLYFSKNGVWQNSGDPTSGATGTGSAFTLSSGTYNFTSYIYYNTFSFAWNFGEGFFGTTAAGTNADDNGQGLFAYDVPAGYYALNTKNLEAYG